MVVRQHQRSGDLNNCAWWLQAFNSKQLALQQACSCPPPLHTRCSHSHTPASLCLQSQLERVEGQLATKAEVGDTLKKVDFDQLRIQHSRAEAAPTAASAEAIALKAQVARAAQLLADQRGALAASAAASEHLRQVARDKEGQAAQLEADAAKVQRECGLLERECQRLREGGASRVHQQGAQPSGKGAPAAIAAAVAAPVVAVAEAHAGEVTTVLDYMRVKSACAEASKAIAGWQRKLEVQAGQRRRAR